MCHKFSRPLALAFSILNKLLYMSAGSLNNWLSLSRLTTRFRISQQYFFKKKKKKKKKKKAIDYFISSLKVFWHPNQMLKLMGKIFAI